MTDVKSSMIDSVHYDGKDKMRVKFKKGDEYEYSVKPELYSKFYDTFQSDDSTGKFFIKHIRQLPAKKVSK